MILYLALQEDGSMFKIYTQEGCLFQCRLENAYNHSGCIPWDFPIPPFLEKGSIRICNSFVELGPFVEQNVSTSESDLATFYDLMNEEKYLSNCSCHPNCEEVKFESQVKCKFKVLSFHN